ncbi:Phosphoribosyl-ATP pyrophosphohydrolase [Halalkaliarchaeum sp. AArc-CO]|uniref:phosphoribosyl-ATP diphosphatase n=1 Tax=unclassified Halalkaliarchaeum TaxID=2678344 RepID=UPI00217E53AF|nr:MULTISPECIES: phosphoribosyl-ATP diphosphatase [unclassified Halalkaliarchaeum]MDR5674566.1 phosphoribosyl-ATP diphosphatase [Halalkaliarchaeum sp. AArc-GB]UWG49481.1 Phosphoribosyl-ATP pyrophosphohydrolase [Halalkaliarchaeum sp. AArc-CO]
MTAPDSDGGETDEAESEPAGTEPEPDVELEAVLDDLFETIEDRQRELPEGSYTASLFTHEKGENAVLEKLGEEATEILLAAKDDDVDELAHESADFVYHLLVLFAMKGLDVDDLRAELRSRFG